jgi:NADPH-dependent ferric siderophore reductase
MVRVTLAGPDLQGLVVPEPAASVRLLLPSPGTSELVVPTWRGNEFLLSDGTRPTIRTFTPRRLDTEKSELELDIVVHGRGAASDWAGVAQRGDPAAISGPGRGYTIDSEAAAFLLVGDETAIAAISQLLETVPRPTPVFVHIEVAEPDGRLALPEHPRATVRWWDLSSGAPPGEALIAAVKSVVEDVELDAAARVWVAGEAAAVQRVRHLLFDGCGLARSQASVRGYWKHGRAGGDDA